jgi:transcriptional regulator with XRE-family HTH domain
MELNQIGNALKLIRNSKNMSLEQESELLGIHRNTLALYENNPENMSLGLLSRFLEIHNINRDIFFKIVYDNSLIKIMDKK